MRRVAVTGIGLVSPLGMELDSFWQALLEGRSGIGAITAFDASTYPCRVGGEVRDRSFEELIEPRKLRTTTRPTRLALAAGELALREARLGSTAYAPDRFSVLVGTALGGWRDAEQQYAILFERGAGRVNPFIVSGAPNHGPGAELASTYLAQGPQLTFSSGCPAALQAISHGALLIANDEIDVCLAGGTEAPIIPLVFAAMGRTQELSTLNEPADAASRPFDTTHAGMVLSEGSCFLVLESLEGAIRRGRAPYAEILGSASSCDAQGMYHFDRSGEAGGRAIHRCLERAGLSAADIDYVCAHANSSPAFDSKETIVLKKSFGEFAARLPVSSIKAVLGHPFGASGAFQAAAASLAIRNRTIPPTHHLITPAVDCDLDYVPHDPRPGRIRSALISSYGYGGVNSYLILREPE